MPYDWKAKRNANRVSAAGGDGRPAAGGAGVYVQLRAPQGLRFTPEFYLRAAHDFILNAQSVSISKEQRECSDFLHEAMLEADWAWPFLSHLQRQADKLAAVQQSDEESDQLDMLESLIEEEEEDGVQGEPA